MKRILTFVILAVGVSWNAAHAATININADLNSLLNPVFVFLEAGTYSVDVIGVADGGAFDAWSNWANTTCADPDGCIQTVPTTVMGWKNSYDVISAALASVEVDGLALTPVAAVPTGIDLFRDFFVVSAASTRYHVDDQMVYATALDALATARSSVFTLDIDSLVGFAINDTPLTDNRGGISLNVSPIDGPPIPEPSTLSLLIGSLVSYGAVKYRRRGQRT